MPRADVHCETNGRPNKLLVKSLSTKSIVAYEYRACAHGSVNRQDKRTKYKQDVQYSCSGCSYLYVARGNGTVSYSSWSCIK